MEERKVYTIAGAKFQLKTDLELDESIEISNLLKNLYSESPTTLAGKFTGEDMKRFLSLVLEPVSADTLPGISGKLPEGFSFGKTKESVQLEVFKDFFLDRMRKVNNSASGFADSILQQQKQ